MSQPQSPSHHSSQQPQMPPPYYYPQPPQDDEIDLRELFAALWKGKWIIIACTFICTALAITYALMAKEQWSSTATITQPKVSDYNQLQDQIIPLQVIFSNGNASLIDKLDDLIDGDHLYNNFIEEFNSSINKKKFLATSPSFQKEKALLDDPEDEDALRKLYNDWYKVLSAKPEDSKKTDGPYVLTASAEASQESLDMLNQYIQYVNKQVENNAFETLTVTIASKKNEFTHQLSTLTEQAKQQLMLEKERSQYALSIAKAAKVSKPLQNFGDNELFAINLGSDALSAKVNALSNVKNLSVIEPRLEELNAKVSQIENVKIDKDVKFSAYRYLEQPEREISRDKPKRALIAILGLLLGGMIGVGTVLVRFAFKQDK